MAFGFLNLLMLAGLAGVALPVMAHLLSKRKYDIVQWGAMQFLQLGNKTKRRIQLQDWLLLLLRMALIALLAIALARPWGQGSVFGKLAGNTSRDVVFILDSSASMDWQDKQTPHDEAIQWIHHALEKLKPGDTVTLIDARSQAMIKGDKATTDFGSIRRQLEDLPAPSGTSNLPIAITEAVKTLLTTSNVSRQVVVLTDQQALPWQIENTFAWDRINDLKRQMEIEPQIQIVRVGNDKVEKNNFSLDRMQLSREMTVPGFPIRLRTTLRQTGGKQTTRNVHFEINGQRVEAMTKQVVLLPDGEAFVEFDRIFTEQGQFVVTAVLDEDNLPGDNTSSAVVTVADGIPTLIVDGDTHVDQTRAESFFVRSVFAASGDQHPWVRSKVITPQEFNRKALSAQRVLLLCNVAKLTPVQETIVTEFVDSGGGLVIAPGEHLDPIAWNRLAKVGEIPFLPAEFGTIESEVAGNRDAITIDHLTLQVPWLQRFRKESGVDFWTSRFSKWWSLNIEDAVEFEPLDLETAPEDSTTTESNGEPNDIAELTKFRPMITAQLSNGSPLMATRRFGEGTILQFATPLDADWGTMPAKKDFVPFLHEMVFHLTSAESHRNVDVGTPLLLPLDDSELATHFRVNGPGIDSITPEQTVQRQRTMARFSATSFPGVYTFTSTTDPNHPVEPFVVSEESDESNLTMLTDAERELLTKDDRAQFVSEVGEIATVASGESTRTELWWLILVGVLVMLVAEVALTRKMVKGGHTALEPIKA